MKTTKGNKITIDFGTGRKPTFTAGGRKRHLLDEVRHSAVTAEFMFPEPDDLEKYLLEDAVEIEGFGGLLPDDETVEEGLDQRFEDLLDNWEDDIRGLVRSYPRVRGDVADAFVKKFPQYAGQRSR